MYVRKVSALLLIVLSVQALGNDVLFLFKRTKGFHNFLHLRFHFSSLSPINRNLPGRRSAFSVVSNVAAKTSTPKEVKPRPISVKANSAKRNRKRKSSSSTASSQQTPEKTVVTVIHLPTNKKTKMNSNECAPSNRRSIKKIFTNGRITRSTSLNKLNESVSSHLDENEQSLLKKAVLEQEKLEKIIEQERKDFEFAKKLQRKLNKAEQEQNRTEYALRKTRGKTKFNSSRGETKIVTKNENEKSDVTVIKGKIKTAKTDETPKISVLRRSTRKR